MKTQSKNHKAYLEQHVKRLYSPVYIFVFVAFVIPGLTGNLRAQEMPEQVGHDGVMTLKDCMEYAISNSTKIRIQQAAIGDAQIDRRDAALALFTPQISAQTYAYYNFGRSIDPQTNTYFNTTSFHNNYGVSAGYDLFDGFKAVNNHKISKTGMLIADSQEKQVEADICLAVMEAYYNVVYYKRLCDVYEEQVAVAEQALAKAKRQEELGQKGHADVIQMEADLADRQYDLTNTYNMYQDQKMTLSDLMFWPVDEELNIDTSMPVWQIDPVATDSVIDFALEHNPGIQIASWQELNAKRELNTAKWQLIPSVGLYAGWNTSYYSYQGSETATFANQFKNNGGKYVEVSLQIPIWSRLSKHSAISRRQHALDKATAELDQKRRDVESEVRRAIQDRDGAATAYQQAQRKAEVQAEAYTLNLKKLEQGLISPLEFQTANNNYLKAQADEVYWVVPFDQNAGEFLPDWHLLAEPLSGGGRYYIGYYSALQIHGLITQPSLKEQVVREKRKTETVVLKGVEFQFIYHNEKHFFGVKKVWIDSYNKVPCSDLEKTIIDCLYMPAYAGGIIEVAKALWTAREKLDYGKLLSYARQFDSQVVIKRLGYLLDKLGIGTEIVEELRALRTAAVSPLDTEVPNEGKICTKWSIRQNVDIETIINAINN